MRKSIVTIMLTLTSSIGFAQSATSLAITDKVGSPEAPEAIVPLTVEPTPSRNPIRLVINVPTAVLKEQIVAGAMAASASSAVASSTPAVVGASAVLPSQPGLPAAAQQATTGPALTDTSNTTAAVVIPPPPVFQTMNQAAQGMAPKPGLSVVPTSSVAASASSTIVPDINAGQSGFTDDILAKAKSFLQQRKTNIMGIMLSLAALAIIVIRRRKSNGQSK